MAWEERQNDFEQDHLETRVLFVCCRLRFSMACEELANDVWAVSALVYGLRAVMLENWNSYWACVAATKEPTDRIVANNFFIVPPRCWVRRLERALAGRVRYGFRYLNVQRSGHGASTIMSSFSITLCLETH